MVQMFKRIENQPMKYLLNIQAKKKKNPRFVGEVVYNKSAYETFIAYIVLELLCWGIYEETIKRRGWERGEKYQKDSQK